MFRPQAQAETHKDPAGPPRTSSPKRGVCCNFTTAYFFLFLNRLQAQAHSNQVGQPLSSCALCRNLFFFLFIFRLQAQAQARSIEATRHA